MADITPTTYTKIEGTTTIRWGTSPIGYLIVESANQKVLAENIKLPNGAGLTTTRIQIVDGVQWDITVRDDTQTAPSTLLIGTRVTVYDYAGHFSDSPGGFVTTNGTGVTRSARVIDNGYNAALKTEGKRTITLEFLNLVEG